MKYYNIQQCIKSTINRTQKKDLLTVGNKVKAKKCIVGALCNEFIEKIVEYFVEYGEVH